MAYLPSRKVCVRHGRRKMIRSRRGGVAKPKARSLATAIQRDEKKARQKAKQASGPRIPECHKPLEDNVSELAPMPEGYSFIPNGDVYITLRCRLKAWESNQFVYKVYDALDNVPIGIRVPSEIHEEILAKSKETERSIASAANARDNKPRGRERQLLRDQFPMMPGHILDAIVEHAFLEGSGRVGCNGYMPDGLRAQLAVEAHIRHNHTPYEVMLERGVNRELARRMVREAGQGIRKAWEGTG
ncbi:hypothetical protein PMG11_04190 [Penicillium brasilianum]|uniref:DUF2293 domain-containing protein n=1 Tax=Penicillium brasilianum TaxID=104259 RepID=A0A0F7VFK5_PENBI|nr:hypothetical protein PMG11_04190 [Penicillium brasilianum]